MSRLCARRIAASPLLRGADRSFAASARRLGASAGSGEQLRRAAAATLARGAHVGSRACSSAAGAAVEPPTRAQLTRLAAAAGIPFIGFGIADSEPPCLFEPA